MYIGMGRDICMGRVCLHLSGQRRLQLKKSTVGGIHENIQNRNSSLQDPFLLLNSLPSLDCLLLLFSSFFFLKKGARALPNYTLVYLLQYFWSLALLPCPELFFGPCKHVGVGIRVAANHTTHTGDPSCPSSPNSK